METPQSIVAALGERARIEGYGLAGSLLLGADSPEEVRQRWAALPAGTGLVLLTATAAAVLEAELRRTDDLLVAVMPP